MREAFIVLGADVIALTKMRMCRTSNTVQLLNSHSINQGK